MADYYLNNQPGAPFRAELNEILAAIRSSNASSKMPKAGAGFLWLDTRSNTLYIRNASGRIWTKIYTTDKKPTKSEIGLSNVPNYRATSSITEGGWDKFATAEAVKILNDNKLHHRSKAVDSAKLEGKPANYYATATHSHTPAAVGAAPAKHSHSESDLPNASTKAQGVVQLSNSTFGSSQTKAATELAVKNAKALAIAAGVPAGAIIMFAGTEAQIPSGWQLTNGQGKTSNGIRVPDLRNRFVICASSAYDVGSRGGSMYSKTNTTGAHSHGAAVGNTTLSVTQMPRHHHTVYNAFSGGGREPYNGGDGSDFNMSYNKNTSATGGNGSHNHSAKISTAGNHNHTVRVMPPYYALCYIIKL